MGLDGQTGPMRAHLDVTTVGAVIVMLIASGCSTPTSRPAQPPTTIAEHVRRPTAPTTTSVPGPDLEQALYQQDPAGLRRSIGYPAGMVGDQSSATRAMKWIIQAGNSADWLEYLRAEVAELGSSCARPSASAIPATRQRFDQRQALGYRDTFVTPAGLSANQADFLVADPEAGRIPVRETLVFESGYWLRLCDS